MTYFDRAGEPISVERWMLLFEDKSYQVLQQDTVGDYMVSTIWMGISLSDASMIFETMVFDGEGEDLEQRRYASEAEALAGHAALLEQVSLFASLSSPQ